MIDFVGSIVMFLVLLPFLLIVAVVLKLSCGQAMFLQERVGYKCRLFKVIKFCTMTDKRDAEGNLLPDAERCTKIGDFLRRWSIDELPQLINIIKGDMSFIGPRPFMPCYVKDCTKKELHRHWVKPGVTGLAQIQGRNSVSYKVRFRYDVWYVRNYSAKVDWMIFYSTVRMILGFDKDRNHVDYDPTIEHGLRT